LTVVCDNIRDPGNMAAIITSAAAVSSYQMLITKGIENMLCFTSFLSLLFESK